MNRIALAVLATAAVIATGSARADTRFSLGVSVGAPAYCPPTVTYAPPPTIAYAAPSPRGYWKDVVVKTWVPERIVASRDRWGRPIRVCEPGYFAYRTDRVWVEERLEHSHRGALVYGFETGRDGWHR